MNGDRWMIATTAALMVVLGVPGASAHGDRDVADITVPLSAGETIAFESELHYHRIAARIDAVGGDGALALAVRDPAGHERIIAGPAASLRVNELVACCDDAVWSDHALLVTNTGDMEVFVDIHIALLHDGVAVAGTNAEPGAAPSVVIIPLVLYAILYTRLRDPVADGRTATWLRRATWTYGAMWTTGAVFALWGMSRYGAGPLAGSIAATADLPVIEGNVASVHLLLSLTLMALWVTTLALWTAAARRRPDALAATVRLGFIIGLGAVVLAVSWIAEYGHVVVPVVMAIAASSYPLGTAAWLHRLAHASSDEGPGAS